MSAFEEADVVHPKQDPLGNIMSDTLTDRDKVDLFQDFLDSDEWIFPIQSFIDYYCIVFPTSDPQEHLSEKQTVFGEYKQIVKVNLDRFLSEVLGIRNDKLPWLLQSYDGDYEELEYLLACEDYDIFHNFMFEANRDADARALKA